MTFFAKKRINGIRDWIKELMRFCAESDLSFNDCNFHVANIHTMFQKDDKEVDPTFFKNTYNQSADKIYQVFDVEITPKEYDFSKLNFTFSYRHLEAILILKEGFLIDSQPDYLPQLTDYIIAFLIQKEIIITSIELIKARLEQIITERFQAPCLLQEEKRFTFLRAKASIRNRGFTNLLEEKWCSQNNRAPLQNALYAVVEGDHIGFYLKDAIVTSGRNLEGEYIDMQNLHSNTPKRFDGKESKMSQDTKEFVTGTFRYKSPPEAVTGVKRIEEGKIIKYEADRNGIIEFGEAGLKLIDIGTFQQVGKTNSILGGVDKMAEVDVDCADKSKDAVQTGGMIEAEVVNIKGTIGEKVIIRAKKLTINGQTHQSSILYAQEASINIHKGILYASEADIDKLEGGKVYAKDLNITDAQGAKIRGNRIVISKLHSNTHIRFCETLHLKAIHGNDNQISFDMFADFEQREKLSTVIQLDSLLRDNISGRIAYCKALVKKLNKIKPVIEQLKPIIEHSKKDGFELDQETKKTLGFYVLLLKQIKDQKDTATALQKIRTENTRKGKEIEQILQSAKITTESSWKDNNQIILSHRFPPSNSSVFTQDSEMFEVCINADGVLEKITQ